uniref:Uncharacterized protein n=1 Tax=Rhizophora mucronata TaxID=61149 RepID=A0A2P2NHW9_RHIMU
MKYSLLVDQLCCPLEMYQEHQDSLKSQPSHSSCSSTSAEVRFSSQLSANMSEFSPTCHLLDVNANLLRIELLISEPLNIRFHIASLSIFFNSKISLRRVGETV